MPKHLAPDGHHRDGNQLVTVMEAKKRARN